MFVSEILSEAEYKVVPFGSGRNKKFNIVSVDSGQVVGSAKNRAMAQNQIKSLTQTTSPADKLKAKATSSNTVDRSKGVKGANDYLDDKGVKDKDIKKAGEPAKVKTPVKEPGRIAKTAQGLKNFADKAGGGVAGSLVFMFVTVDTLMADLETYANVYKKTDCNLRDNRMNAAQVRFGDRLTSNVMATALALVGTGLAIKAVKKILMVLRAGALFAGPAGWIGYLISWVGAEAAIYAMVKMLEAKWFHAAISDYLMNTAFTKRQLVRLASGFGIIGPDHPCYQKSAGFIRKEAVGDEDQDVVFETVSKSEIKAGIKDLIVGDPKMLALMKKAKKNKEKGVKAEVA